MRVNQNAPAMPVWHLGVLAALYVPCVAAFEPVFGDGVGLRAGGAGVAVGLLVALAVTFLRWDAFTTIAAGIVAYLAGAGAAALPQTAIAGLVPTWQTVQMTVVESITAWKDVLTLSPPESAYEGPAVMPWLAGLACALVSGVLVVRRGNYVAAVVPMALFGGIGIAWGLGNLRPPAWPAILWTGCVLAWWAWCGHRGRVTTGEEIVVGRTAVGAAIADSLSETSRAAHVGVVRPVRRIGALVLTLGIAGAVAWQGAPAWTAPMPRSVLRDVVTPPLVIEDYPTPLAAFRHYETDLVDDDLIDITGLPNQARVRIAAMDTYNGVVFGMSGQPGTDDGGFVPVGRVLRANQDVVGDQAHLTLATHGLIGPWVPTVGSPEQLQFSGPSSAALEAGLYVNRSFDTVLTTSGMSGDVNYTLDTTVQPTSSEGQLRNLSTPPMTSTPDSNLPRGAAELARTATAGAQTQYDRVFAIARYLEQNGLFADQNTTESQPGHRADRLERMLSGDQMVGDDEQYATLMTLMVHSLGIPARAVMGLYPDTWPTNGETLALRGTNVHIWVEVLFDEVGWVTFDPTPPRDQVPKTDTKHPKSVPIPQVLPPPDPPKEPVDLPPSVTDRPDLNPPPQSLEIPWTAIGAGGLGVLVIGGPIVAIVLAKSLRRRRRERAPVADAAVRGAWDELVDFAVDTGADAPINLTRQELALVLAQSGWDTASSAETVATMARYVDEVVFSERMTTGTDVGTAWTYARSVRGGRVAHARPWSRLRAALSLRSFRRRRMLARTVRMGSKP